LLMSIYHTLLTIQHTTTCRISKYYQCYLPVLSHVYGLVHTPVLHLLVFAGEVFFIGASNMVTIRHLLVIGSVRRVGIGSVIVGSIGVVVSSIGVVVGGVGVGRVKVEVKVIQNIHVFGDNRQQSIGVGGGSAVAVGSGVGGLFISCGVGGATAFALLGSV